ncbi:MAG: transporter permease protein [Rickettsiaceae bacterium]|jgi:phospholipid/cholesterol/gamma-HCH transport system permease protein|nr:transporter permease protein [Rickettsiaceae bacterium]
MNYIQELGRTTLLFSERSGALLLFSLHAVLSIFKTPFDFRSIYAQFKTIGFYSLPVVGMTALFSGAVLALQSYTGFSRFMVAESSVATVVVLSITRELGPVMAGLMVAGRVGAAIAAEIGTMKVTEQIDALYTLSTEPIKYLVSPRLIACLIMLPCLVIVADVIGVLGGYLVCVYKLGFNETYYVKNTFKYLEAIDVISGLVKAAAFGVIIAIIGCYNGYNSGKGAQGVGSATTAAVVSSSALILLANYIITECFFSK